MEVVDKILDFFGFERVEDELEEETAQTAENWEEAQKKAKKILEERRQEISHAVTQKGDMILVEPKKKLDAKVVCNELKEAKTVVINVKNISADDTVRFLDFIQGVVYALEGQLLRVSEEVIVAAPKGIDIQTSQVDMDRDYIDDEDYDDDDDDELEYGY